MSYKLLPRFQYTLSTITYLKSWFKPHEREANLPYELDKIYFLNNARSGLKVLLESTGKERIMVGVSVYTCETVMQAIQLAGHEIVFIDINERFQLDLEDLKSKSKKIDLLIATHTFGYPERFDQIRLIMCDSIIIEDCAHSFLSKYKGAYTGTLGDAAIFSMGIGKFPPIGEGGYIMINNPNRFPNINNVINNIKKISGLTQFTSHMKTIILSILMKPPIYGVITYPLGKKLDRRYDLLKKKKFDRSKGELWFTRVFQKNFTVFENLLEKQQDNANSLARMINNPAIKIPEKIIGANNYLFPVLVKNGRDNLYNDLINNDIEAGKQFSNALRWAKKYGYIKGTCPCAENISLKILTLPVHSIASSGQLTTCARIVNEFGKNGK